MRRALMSQDAAFFLSVPAQPKESAMMKAVTLHKPAGLDNVSLTERASRARETMMPTQSKLHGLPLHLVEWIRQRVGAEPEHILLRAGGGASREGAFVDLRYPDGQLRPCYLTYDLRPADASDRLAGFAAEASAIEAVKAHGVQVPGMVAWDASLQAMLTERVPGDPDFDSLKLPAEREQVAADFMAQLATLHAIDPAGLALQGFAALAPPSTFIRQRLLALQAKHERNTPDPLHVFTLRWLLERIPADPPRTVLVHGDAGPANFLHHEGRVSALLDWEMTHFGDPMEDLGWIAVRNLFLDFPDFSFLFEAYERAGGQKVDVERVHFHRIYALACLIIDSHADLVHGSGPFAGIFGNNLNYYTVHTCAAVQGMAEAIGLELAQLELPRQQPGRHERSFSVALDELRSLILPRVPDTLAAHRLKSLARLVKYWQQLDRYGATSEQAETMDINAALAVRHASLPDARAALVQAITERGLPDADVLRLLHRRVERERFVMAPAMGAFAARRFAPLPAR
jgi:aminoglycoside phosphotransferase (APT) family kinase protein